MTVSPVEILKVRGENFQKEKDLLAAEEPLEIRLEFGEEHQRTEMQLAVTMRTPGADTALAVGFLIGEGLISAPADVLSVRHCETVKPEEQGNVIRVRLRPGLVPDQKKLERHVYMSSSCGVCGKTSVDAVRTQCPILPKNEMFISSETVHSLPDKLREAQLVFEHTGGLHAAALFSPVGELQMLCEDVGRHNALDKLIGTSFLKNQQPLKLPLNENVLLVSGRASFELVQKALMAGLPVMVAVGAPSSLAVSLAKEGGLTLIGFARQKRFNIYTHTERVERS